MRILSLALLALLCFVVAAPCAMAGPASDYCAPYRRAVSDALAKGDKVKLGRCAEFCAKPSRYLACKREEEEDRERAVREAKRRECEQGRDLYYCASCDYCKSKSLPSPPHHR